MRACFMGQNVFALGFGTATLQARPLVMDKPAGLASDENVTAPPSESVAHPQRPDPQPVVDRMTVM